MKRTVKILVALLIVLALVPAPVKAAIGIEDQVSIFLVGDYESGEIFESSNIDEPQGIASLTKIMTYLVVKDAIAKGSITAEDVYTVDEVSAGLAIPGNSHFGLLLNEKITVANLLMGLMVVSGNDAANALALHTSGSVPAFVEAMNQKARDLGMTTAVFYNPSGLTENGQVNRMSARDMFTLSRHVVQTYPEVLDYAAIRNVNMPERNFQKASSIPLVNEIPGVNGLKTGYTPEAGNCLVTTCDVHAIDPSKNLKVMGVILGIKEKGIRDEAMGTMITYVAENYARKKLTDPEKPYTTIKVNSATGGTVALYPDKPYETIVGPNTRVHYEEKIDSWIKAPIAQGTKLGTLTITVGNEEPQSFVLSVKENVGQADKMTRVTRIIEEMFYFAGKVL